MRAPWLLLALSACHGARSNPPGLDEGLTLAGGALSVEPARVPVAPADCPEGQLLATPGPACRPLALAEVPRKASLDAAEATIADAPAAIAALETPYLPESFVPAACNQNTDEIHEGAFTVLANGGLAPRKAQPDIYGWGGYCPVTAAPGASAWNRLEVEFEDPDGVGQGAFVDVNFVELDPTGNRTIAQVYGKDSSEEELAAGRASAPFMRPVDFSSHSYIIEYSVKWNGLGPPPKLLRFVLLERR